MRRLRAALTTAALAAALVAPATGEAAALKLSPAAGKRFPERSFLLTLPERVALRASQVRVRENGRDVQNLRVEPLAAARAARLGVVLAIDTSSSMRGPALAGALDAARAFAQQRRQNQPLALMTFDGHARLVRAFTTDPEAIDRALSATPRAGGGTRVYDAAAAAVRQIRGTRLRGGFVVVLSDGSDRHSRATPAAVAAAARAAHVRIYTVGLRSRATDFAALQQLAAQSGGGYSEASSASQLRRIYATLGGELSNGYLVRYQSLAATRQVVSVTASVAGLGTAETSYRAPRLAAVAHPAKRSPLWSSPAATLVAAFLVPVLLGTAALLLLGRARRQTPRERVAQFVAPPQREPEGPELAGGLTAGANRSLARSSRWAELAKELDVARISTPPVRALLLAAGGTLGVALVVGVASGEALAGLAALACVPFALRAELRRRVARQQQLFDEQLVDNLTVMASALRAGHSLVGALAAVVDEAPDPTRRELRRVVADERLGAPLEDALAGAVRRMKSQELDQVAMLAVLQRETGGNTAEMLDRVAEGIRQRHELKRMVRSLTAQGRLSHAVITILPLALFFGISLLIPGYMDPMLHTTTGVLLLIIAGAMVAAGSLVIKRIVEIEI